MQLKKYIQALYGKLFIAIVFSSVILSSCNNTGKEYALCKVDNQNFSIYALNYSNNIVQLDIDGAATEITPTKRTFSEIQSIKEDMYENDTDEKVCPLLFFSKAMAPISVDNEKVYQKETKPLPHAIKLLSEDGDLLFESAFKQNLSESFDIFGGTMDYKAPSPDLGETDYMTSGDILFSPSVCKILIFVVWETEQIGETTVCTGSSPKYILIIPQESGE